MQSQEQSRVEGEQDHEGNLIEEQEDLCELHRSQAQFQQSMEEYQLRKNAIME